MRKKCLWKLLQGSHRRAGNQAAAKSLERWQARGRELAGGRADCSSRGSGEMEEKREKTEAPQSQEGDAKGAAASTGPPKGRLPSADITLYTLCQRSYCNNYISLMIRQFAQRAAEGTNCSQEQNGAERPGKPGRGQIPHVPYVIMLILSLT